MFVAHQLVNHNYEGFFSDCVQANKKSFPLDNNIFFRSRSVMDSHATAWGSIHGGNSVKTELHVLHDGQ